MYIVYVIGDTSEKMIFEERAEAYEYALGVSKELKGVQVNIYKASLVATVELPTEPIIIKIKKARVAKQEVVDKVMPKIVKKYAKIEEKKKAPIDPSFLPIDPVFKDIASDNTIPSEGDPEENDVPIGARCELDNNMAVGKRKGPTGEFVYLCVDCMGALA